MRRVEGGTGVKMLECTNPVRNRWRIRWDVTENERGCSYMEEELDHEPGDDEIRSIITGWYNSQTDKAILEGFEWNGMKVWLSQENQFNYKASYDLAAQTGGKSLPVTFKFGTDDEVVYHQFQTLEELSDFYLKAMQHIHRAMMDGWKQKDTFNISLYSIKK